MARSPSTAPRASTAGGSGGGGFNGGQGASAARPISTRTRPIQSPVRFDRRQLFRVRHNLQRRSGLTLTSEGNGGPAQAAANGSTGFGGDGHGGFAELQAFTDLTSAPAASAINASGVAIFAEGFGGTADLQPTPVEDAAGGAGRRAMASAVRCVSVGGDAGFADIQLANISIIRASRPGRSRRRRRGRRQRHDAWRRGRQWRRRHRRRGRSRDFLRAPYRRPPTAPRTSAMSRSMSPATVSYGAAGGAGASDGVGRSPRATTAAMAGHGNGGSAPCSSPRRAGRSPWASLNPLRRRIWPGAANDPNGSLGGDADWRLYLMISSVYRIRSRYQGQLRSADARIADYHHSGDAQRRSASAYGKVLSGQP